MVNTLKLYVQRIKNLPTIPVIAQEILGVVDNELTSVDKLERIIENDPAISAKILSVANSAFFGVSTPARTLNNAILRIGFDNVKNIALGISLMTVLGSGRQGKSIDYQRIFNHCVTVGFVARLIAKKLKMSTPEEILMNALIHDIGFLVLNRYFPDNYVKVLTLFEEGRPLLDAEKEVLEFTHADIGAWLAEQWKLPGNVIDSTRYHHAPALAKKNMKQIAIIHLADYVSSCNVLPATAKNPDYPFDTSAFEILDISEDSLRTIEAEVSGLSFSGEIF
jgi:putative nucleotidyltransferase with HDIG domain